MVKDNDKTSTQEDDVDINTVNDSLPSDGRTDPHWLLHELNEILEKGMFKNG
jgi:hypothetical protein